MLPAPLPHDPTGRPAHRPLRRETLDLWIGLLVWSLAMALALFRLAP
jgi:hypothetical protein